MSTDSPFDDISLKRNQPKAESICIAPKIDSSVQQVDDVEDSICISSQREIIRRNSSSLQVKARNEYQLRKLQSIRAREQQPPSTEDSHQILKSVLQRQTLNNFKEKLMTNAYILQSKFKNQIQYIFDEEIPSVTKTPNKYFSKFLSITNQLEMYLIEPSSMYARLIDLVLILVSLYSIWFAFFSLSFSLKVSTNIILYFSVMFMLIMDMVSNCNRAIVIQGEVIRSRRIIIGTYMKEQLLTDLLAFCCWILLPLDFIMQPGLIEVLTTLTAILFVRKIYKIYQANIEWISVKDHLIVWLDLLTLIVSIYMFAHFIACLWNYVAEKSSNTGITWLMVKQIQNESYWVKYNYSFYFATMTMVTVGYGDITPTNHVEVTTCSIIMFISTCVFGYSMNSIGILVSNINEAKQQYKQLFGYLRHTFAVINSYMKNNNVDLNLQNRVRNYLQFYIKHQKDNTENINKILQHLPVILKNELVTDIQMKAIRQIKQIVKYFSLQSQIQISSKLERLRYTPGEYVYHQEDKSNQSLYFIIEGSIKVIEEKSQKVLTTLKQDQNFGQYQLFTGFPPKTACISEGFSQVFKISREQFLECIKNNKKDQEQFNNIKDYIIFSKNFDIIDMKCSICQKYDHQNIDCPLINYTPNIEFLIKRMNYLSSDRDDKYSRNMKRRKFRSLINHSELKLIIESIREVYKEELASQPSQEPEESEEDNEMEESIHSDVKKIQSSKDSRIDKILETKVSQRLESSLVQPIFNDETQNNLQFHLVNIDQMARYQSYRVHNNIDNVLKALDRQRVLNPLLLKIASLYTFIFDIKCLAVKLRSKFINAKRRRTNVQVSPSKKSRRSDLLFGYKH